MLTIVNYRKSILNHGIDYFSLCVYDISIGAGPVEPAEIQEQALQRSVACRGRSPASDNGGTMVENDGWLRLLRLLRISIGYFLGIRWEFSDQQI